MNTQHQTVFILCLLQMMFYVSLAQFVKLNHDPTSTRALLMRQLYIPGLHGSITNETDDDVSWEMKIKRHILRNYDPTSRPVRNDSETINVVLGLSLYHILDTDEKFQTITTLIFIRQRWNDAYLRWNKEDFGGMKKVWIRANEIWRPDIAINNNADQQSNEIPLGNVIVKQDGDVLFMSQAVAKTYCVLNVRHFPFDRQRCPITFVSWTYSGAEVNIDKEPGENFSYYSEVNQEWSIDNITAVKHVKTYACCPEPYPDIEFALLMHRRSMFYIFNLIFPCLLIYVLSFAVFFLPVESNEKVTMEITVLLATMVFLMVINDTLPPTPDAIPLLGMLFATITLIVSIALVMAVLVTNIYYRKDGKTRVPHWLRRLLLNRWLVQRQRKQARPKVECNSVHYDYDPDGAQSHGGHRDILSTGLIPMSEFEQTSVGTEHNLITEPALTRSVEPRRSRGFGARADSAGGGGFEPSPHSQHHSMSRHGHQTIHASDMRGDYAHLLGQAHGQQHGQGHASSGSQAGTTPGSLYGNNTLNLFRRSDSPSQHHVTPLGMSNRQCKESQAEQFAEEWKLFAQKMDAFFFWVLLIIGSTLLFSIFVNVPQ